MPILLQLNTHSAGAGVAGGIQETQMGASSVQLVARIEDAPAGAMEHPDVHQVCTVGDDDIGVLASQLIGAHHRLGIPICPKPRPSLTSSRRDGQVHLCIRRSLLGYKL